MAGLLFRYVSQFNYCKYIARCLQLSFILPSCYSAVCHSVNCHSCEGHIAECHFVKYPSADSHSAKYGMFRSYIIKMKLDMFVGML